MTDKIKFEADKFDSFTRDFLASNSIAVFQDLFHNKNLKTLRKYVSQPELVNFLSRDADHVTFNANGPVYESNFEKEFYNICYKKSLIDIPYRTRDNFMLSSNGSDVRGFLAKKAFDFFVKENSGILGNNIHISPEILTKTSLAPQKKDKCLFTNTKFYKDNFHKIQNSDSNEHLFLSVTVPEHISYAHTTLTGIIFDKKTNAVKAIIDIDSTPQSYVDNTERAIRGQFYNRLKNKEKIVPVGISIQCGQNDDDRNCAFHSHNMMNALLQTLYNKPHFLNHINELLDNGKIDEMKKDIGFNISKNMPYIFNLDKLQKEGVIRQLPLNKIIIESAKDRFTVSSAMIPEILAGFCRSHVREL